jgi:hypothetical protein
MESPDRFYRKKVAQPFRRSVTRCRWLGMAITWRYTYPVTVEPFPVFIGNVGMVGKVDDAELRRSIVRAYALARGLLDSFRLNNASVAEYKRLKTMNGPPETNLFTRTHRDRMVEYAGKLKERDEWVEQAVKDLLSRAEQWLNVHPPR